jgi:transmembrane 9 superfamily protein 2/4
LVRGATLQSCAIGQFYYVFGFLALVVVILVITCSEISIVLVYFQLCSEDYNWWWRSMLTAGSSGLYLFLYGIFYYSTKVRMGPAYPALRCAALRCAALRCAALRCLALPCAALYCAFRWLTRRPRLRIQLDIMGFTSGLMYFGYMFLASYAFSVGTGTIGFISSFFFVRAIYGSIKVD